VNCAETIQDRLGRPAYEMFGINHRFQQCKDWPPRFRSPPYDRIKFGYLLENVRFLLLSTNLAREWLQTDTDSLHIITSTADELSGVPTSMTLNDLEPKNRGFSDFFCYFRLRRTLRVNFR